MTSALENSSWSPRPPAPNPCGPRCLSGTQAAGFSSCLSSVLGLRVIQMPRPSKALGV